MDLRASNLVSTGLASNSRRAYSYAVSRYISFCSRYSFDPFQLEELTVLRSIAYLESESSSISPSTIRVYLAGIRAWLITNGIQVPLIYTQRVKWALLSLDSKAPIPLRVRPFTIDMFRKVLGNILYSYDNVHLFSAMLLGYFGCLRAAEYCPSSGGPPPLLPSHCRFVDSDSPYFLIDIQSSKTAVKGFTLVVGCSHSFICAVCWLRRCLSIRVLPPHLPLFSFRSGAPITRAALSSFMKDVLVRSGLDPSNISPHSLWGGSTTDAAGLGLPDSAIQRLGRWRSSAFRAYIRPSHSQLALSAPLLASVQGHAPAPECTQHW